MKAFIKNIKKHLPLLIFILSLGFFVFFFFIQRNFMTNIDERDHIVSGFLMARGQKVYKDFFTTHFPFPYYWVYIFSPFWVNAAFYRAISIFRFTLVFLYLLSFLAVFFASKNRKTKIAISLWIVLLSFFACLYHGNLLLSETFVAIFIISIFWLTIPLSLGWEKINLYKSNLIFIFASLAFWTQPFTAPLFLIPFIFIPVKTLKKLFPVYLFINLLPLVFFQFSGQLPGFWENAIWFNLKVYSKFFPEKIGNYSMFTQNIVMFFKNEVYFLTRFSNLTQIWQFLIHLATIFLLIIILKKKNWKIFLSFLILFYATRTREIKIIPGKIFNFGIYPFVLLGSASFMTLAIYFFSKKKIITLLALGFLFAVSIKEVSPVISQSLKPGYNYHVFWSWRQEAGQAINRLTKPDEKILIYPHDVDLYFFSGRQPIDRFTYWFPWLDFVEKYHHERQEALASTPPAVIYLGNLVYNNDPELYGKLFPSLLVGYERIYENGQETNLWIRKDLNSRLEAPLITQ